MDRNGFAIEQVTTETSPTQATVAVNFQSLLKALYVGVGLATNGYRLTLFQQAAEVVPREAEVGVASQRFQQTLLVGIRLSLDHYDFAVWHCGAQVSPCCTGIEIATQGFEETLLVVVLLPVDHNTPTYAIAKTQPDIPIVGIGSQRLLKALLFRAASAMDFNNVFVCHDHAQRIPRSTGVGIQLQSFYKTLRLRVSLAVNYNFPGIKGDAETAPRVAARWITF